jgi:hypothetical protein
MSLFARLTKDELRRPLPGDALVSNAVATVIHTARIRAPLRIRMAMAGAKWAPDVPAGTATIG